MIIGEPIFILLQLLKYHFFSQIKISHYEE